MMDPEPHANKIYNMVGEYQAGNQIVRSWGVAGLCCAAPPLDR